MEHVVNQFNGASRNQNVVDVHWGVVVVMALIASFAVGMLSPSTGVAESQTSAVHSAKESRNSDYEVQARIEKRLRLEDDIQWRNLSVQVADGEVTLNGMVRTQEDKGLATKLTVTVPGVKSLKNRIIVDPHLPRLKDDERPHIETTRRDRVIEGQARLRDQQIMP